MSFFEKRPPDLEIFFVFFYKETSLLLFFWDFFLSPFVAICCHLLPKLAMEISSHGIFILTYKCFISSYIIGNIFCTHILSVKFRVSIFGYKWIPDFSPNLFRTKKVKWLWSQPGFLLLKNKSIFE